MNKGAVEQSMTPTDRSKVLLFLALFFGAAGFLFMLLSCGTEYWLLAAESCSRPEENHGGNDPRHGKGILKTGDDVRIFHEGLFWHCSFTASSADYSIWDLWISKPPLSKACRTAFLFPFPVREPSGLEPGGLPSEPYERPSAIVFRTFWSIFLVAGVTAVVIGGLLAICAVTLTNHKLCRVGGALQLSGGVFLLAVVVMYLMWTQVLDTLEQFALHQRVSRCPFFHLTVQHGPSFLMAPVAVFFTLLAGHLFILVGRRVQGTQSQDAHKTSTTEL
ncbi:transmembrane protein 182-like [Cololabis saira]|uniref:transmembrane protein 182-like n=1 Tax=Cololabis saira TaxID=129043 RepID=UPI002AD289B4|nr:transmembrane protein 182-like [Cololabis saira]